MSQVLAVVVPFSAALLLLLSFAYRFKNRPCPHKRIRCIHGDEIISTIRFQYPTFAIVRCLDCRRPLYDRSERPEICTATNGAHLD